MRQLHEMINHIEKTLLQNYRRWLPCLVLLRRILFFLQSFNCLLRCHLWWSFISSAPPPAFPRMMPKPKDLDSQAPTHDFQDHLIPSSAKFGFKSEEWFDYFVHV